MLRQLLIIWLIINTLGYGTAWAFDGHFGEVMGHQTASEDREQTPNGDYPTCDHCCHAAAHTLGLPSYPPSPVYPSVSMGYTPYQHNTSCYLVAPPERPPQA